MRLLGMWVLGASALAAGQVTAQPRTLQDALASAYSNNPTLQSSRAQLRATDEGVSQALAGWRPTVVVGAGYGYGLGTLRSNGTERSRGGAVRENRDIILERRLELHMEGQRWFDLVRTGRALAVMAPYGMKDYMTVFPIPQAQIDIVNDPAILPQNPGYN